MTCAGSARLQDTDATKYPPREVVFSQDDALAVQEVLDYVAKRVQELQEETGAPVMVIPERRVSSQRYLDTTDCDGTADITLIAKGFVEIIDAKFGAGVGVPIDTPQVELYLLGALADIEDRGLNPCELQARLTIAQPRCHDIEPTIRSRDIEIGEWLAPFVDRVKEKIEATRAEDAPIVASEAGCRFCDAKENGCSTYVTWCMQQAGVLAEGEDLPEDASAVFDKIQKFSVREPYRLSGAQLRGIVDGAQVLKGALSAVLAHATDLLVKGAAPPELAQAYKLVRGRANRKWALEDGEIEKRLKKIKVLNPETGKDRALGKKDLTEVRMKPVTGIEKLLKGLGIPTKDARYELFQALVTKPEGALTLAPISDSRPSVKTAVTMGEAVGSGPDTPAPEIPGSPTCQIQTDYDPFA
jgi:hypothetical protein